MPRGSAKYQVAIVSHVFATGPAHALQEYLRRKRRSHIFIGHPFAKRPPEPSFWERTSAEGVSLSHRAPGKPPPEPYRYFLDFLVTLWWLARSGPVDVLVGCGNLNAFAGLVMRRLGRVRRVVFYAIDYVPMRFNQRALNAVYHGIERAVIRHSDWIWNLSPAMAEARAAAGIRLDESAPQLVVPMGGGFDLAKRPRRDKEPVTIAFVGHLLEKQGVQIVLQALPDVLREVPEARLLVMGTGPHEQPLRSLAEDLGLGGHVEFTGFIANFAIVQQRLAESTIGVAPYLGELDRWTRFADPGKIKDYLAAALPVVTTDVPPIATDLVRYGAGVIVEPDAAAVADALVSLLTDRATLERMTRAAFNLAQEYDWVRIFDGAFESSVGVVG